MKRAAAYWVLIVLLGMGCTAPTTGDEIGQGRRFVGELMVIIADNFDQMTSEVHYHLLLDNDDGMVPLKFKDRRELPELSSGLRIEVVGSRQEGAIAVESIRILETP